MTKKRPAKVSVKRRYYVCIRCNGECHYEGDKLFTAHDEWRFGKISVEEVPKTRRGYRCLKCNGRYHYEGSKSFKKHLSARLGEIVVEEK